YTSTQSPLAAEVLARIAKLYEIEGEIRGQPPDVRQAVRQLRSRPLVEDLRLWLQDHVQRVPGWSDLAKAMRYALRHWDGLILYLDVTGAAAPRLWPIAGGRGGEVRCGGGAM